MKTISKEEIANLPLATFSGRIIVVQTESEVQKAVSYLSEFSSLGFDTETRPSFTKGKQHVISLIQICTNDTCFLFRLNRMHSVVTINTILNNPHIKKIGLSLRDDFRAIKKYAELEFDFKSFIELQSFVKKFGIEDNGLQRIYAILFGEKISKSQRLSNWEADVLTPAQQKYAALDAWACLSIYNKLIRLNPLSSDKYI